MSDVKRSPFLKNTIVFWRLVTCPYSSNRRTFTFSRDPAYPVSMSGEESEPTYVESFEDWLLPQQGVSLDGEVWRLTKGPLIADQTLTIRKEIKIVGEGENMVEIICPLILVYAENVEISGIHFKGALGFEKAHSSKLTQCMITGDEKARDGVDALCKVIQTNDMKIHSLTLRNMAKRSALSICDHSSVEVENLDVFSGNETLLVVGESTVSVSNSKLAKTDANGVFCNRNSDLKLVNCEILETGFPAVYVMDGKVVVCGCKFRGIAQNAISVNQCKKFLIEKNDLATVDGSAIAILDESQGLIRENTVHSVGGNGIFVSAASQVEVIGNKVTSNTYPGIAILAGSTAYLEDNNIDGVVYSAICARAAKSVRMVKCRVSNSKDCGISVSDTKDCVIEDCDIVTCETAGVESYNSSVVTVKNCRIKDINQVGFLAYAYGRIEASDNYLEDAKRGLCALKCRGSAVVSGTRVKNVEEQVDASTLGDFLFYNNGSFKNVTNSPELIPEGMTQFTVLPAFVDKDKDLCLKCHSAPRECFLVDCGHRVYCQKCADEAAKNSENCPLCRFPVSKGLVGYKCTEDGQCLICSEKKAECIILPCGHIGYCRECLQEWYKQHRMCPTCRCEQSHWKDIIWDL